MKDANRKILLVDENDNPAGESDKQTVHDLGLLHRAFSVFVFNTKGELLLQQRADSKYHSAGLWSNTCCSHPSPAEETLSAAEMRLKEEMGVSCNLQHIHHFIYKTEFENGLTEHEFDHVFIGVSDSLPQINFNEVKNWKYISIKDLSTDLQLNPDNYTIWIKICLPVVIEKYKDYLSKDKNNAPV